MTKPVITIDQMIKASEAAKKFGEVRRKAKKAPLFITENGNIDAVLLDYEAYECMYEFVTEIESILDEIVLPERLESIRSAKTAHGSLEEYLRKSYGRMQDR